MKIQGPNHSNFNPYQKQMQKQAEIKKEVNKNDQLQISNEAKKLQQNEKVDPARLERVEQIKQSVESGEYTVDPKQTAKKMLQFWNNQA
ncbi:flagellar biosynthesis anti-sigma factor FlgM [Aquibacillus sediminis]|uniref:flagellar biosynthesis anti-sigma factor FlgM n=1 Tax=Aquibacillus sediminis TaxID=2574734 RepID=UPI001109C4F7|nr:flagellar biosynthesis anti-sigma factor FlgM [Aquibacillus sediminis]